jgi:hypothetical protein
LNPFLSPAIFFSYRVYCLCSQLIVVWTTNFVHFEQKILP